MEALALPRSVTPIVTSASSALFDRAAARDPTTTRTTIVALRIRMVTGRLLVTSERETNAELERSRITHRGDGVEVRDRSGGVDARTEHVVARHVVYPVRDVERFN